MRNDDVRAEPSRLERPRWSPERAGQQALAYCAGMTAATAFGLGSVLLIEGITYPEKALWANLQAFPPAALLLLLLSILATVMSASLIPFILVRWVMVRMMPRVGWIGAAMTGGMASPIGLVVLDYALWDLAVSEPPAGGVILAMAFSCGGIAGLVYRALGGFPPPFRP